MHSKFKNCPSAVLIVPPGGLRNVLYSIPYSFLGLILIFSILPLLIYRWILAKLYFRIHGTEILSGESVFYPIVMPELQKRSNVLLTIKVEGESQFKETLNLFSTRLVEATNSEGIPKFPQFKQYITHWRGYAFWTKESNFEITEHIRPSPLDWSPEFENVYIDEGFSSEKSPWEILCMKGTDVEHHYLLIKFHHSLGDGYSILNTLLSGSNNSSQSNIRPIQKLSIPQILAYPFRAVVDFLNVIKLHETFETSAIHIPISKMSNSRTYVTTQLISKTVVNKYASELGVSFSAALFGLISSGLAKYLQDEQEQGNSTVPQFMSSMIPVPGINSDSDNNFGLIQLPLPTAQGNTLSSRIQLCQTYLSFFSYSTYSITTQLLRRLLGSLPSRLWLPSEMPPVFISSFPGPKSTVFLNSKSILEMTFRLHCAGSYALMITILTYNGLFRIVLAGDKETFKSYSSLQNLANDIETAFKF